MAWTEEQQKVIELGPRNILVSAAAGSGKTAVLVERIIQMLTRDKDPVDVDQLLIVTFTEAAAAEMKERIRSAIEDKLEEQPDNAHLQRQATLIHSAQITTIDSFCNSVIKEHFHVIGLDPGFRVGEEGECKLLRQDVLSDLLEECYAEQDPEFLALTEKLGNERSDKKLEEQILCLYDDSRRFPQPEKWLKQCVDNYEGQGNDQLFQEALTKVKSSLQDMEEMIREALEISAEPDGPAQYAEMLESDLEQCQDAGQAENFEQMYERLTGWQWMKLSGKRSEPGSEDKKEQVKNLRNQAKELHKDLLKTYFYEDPEECRKDMLDAMPTMRTMASLVSRFAEAFQEKKRGRNLIDFDDMEQYALQILTVEQDGDLIPSPTAKEYQDQFVEVMIDEYQDINLIQETILNSVTTTSRGKNNLFMVGDVKQSIYRFRSSRPELFMEKYDRYTKEDSPCQRIDLSKNFRSRTEVLDSVNYLFRRIMRKELGGISYDDDAALYPGADFEPANDVSGQSPYVTDLILVEEGEKKENKKEDKKEKEASAVAEQIHELVGHLPVKDKESGQMRPARYGDIVILIRSMKGWSDTYTKTLTNQGIPVYAASREGYFETYEISVLMDYLKILDNPRQDLPLTAVLTSPFVRLSTQELAEIKTAFPGETFYEAVQSYAWEKEGETAEKLKRFYEQLSGFRERVPYTAIHDLLREILEETGYRAYMAAMTGGEQRLANLEMLLEKASEFEKTSYKGLFNFVRYIEQLEKNEVDYGEANIADENADVVRLMSFHKSKGLEFPIVIVTGLGKQFNKQDSREALLFHPRLGIGVDDVDLDKRTRVPTFLKNFIRQEIDQDTLGEELRLLYVAMTRAKEKLILTGFLSDRGQGQLSKREPDAENETPLSLYQLSSARNDLDWILPALEDGEKYFRVRLISEADLCFNEQVEKQSLGMARQTLEHWDKEVTYDERLREELQEQLTYQYPYADEQEMKMKFTVSELKKREYLSEESGEVLFEEAEETPLLPRFVQPKEELQGASRGSAYHKALELIDFSKDFDAEAVQEEIRRLTSEHRLSDEMADCIRVEDLLGFLNGSLGSRMKTAARAGKLYREQPFVMGVSASEIYPDTESDETLLVQGIIDVFFEEDDGIVLMDYKTDRVKEPSELVERYHAQLEYYAKALEQLLEKPVKEKWIYSFTLKEEIPV